MAVVRNAPFSSFRRKPESMFLLQWIPAFAGMTAAFFILPAFALAQPSALERAMDLEGKSQFRDAAREYRAALLVESAYAMALAGLERSLHELGHVDSLFPVVDSIVRLRPADAVARTVQFRALQTLNRSQELRAAFEAWRGAAPREAAPYREYARLLIDGGKVALADSVLRDAERTLTTTRALSIELAQVRAALGFWDQAAESWRRAVEDAEYLENAAVFGLAPAPLDQRDRIRAVFVVAPAVLSVRKTLSILELGWGSAQLAWNALSELPRSDSTTIAWLEFADRAEAIDAWIPMRDALLAALAGGRDAGIASRAARAAVSGGDAQGGLKILTDAARGMEEREAARWFAVVHVRALAGMGRPTEAEIIATQYSRLVEATIVSQIQNEVAWGWVRAGDIERARKSLATGMNANDAGDIAGWIALYSGDLRTARAQLRGYGDAGRFPGTLTAMSIMSRTRADSSLKLGSAFLALARADTVSSARDFQASAEQLTEAASLLLSTSARLLLGRRDTTATIALWRTIVEKHSESPEAAEADLEWSRVLRKRGDRAGSIERLEHLILSYPSSALLPQARRELESLKGGTIPQMAGANQ